MADITRSEPKIEAIQSIYQLGYMLEEVRVTYKEDAKMSTGNISRTMNRERIAKPHDLSGVDVDFYVRVSDYLEGLKERERENLIISLNTFVASRLEKIVKLAAASSLSPELEGKLSAEEKELYILINKVSTKFKKGVLKKFV